MSVNVVIGANYGDEGKGMVTNALARLLPASETAVVRFNGGAQAGHTVELHSGHRHVFSHFGSGSLVGAATILSKHFLINPRVYHHESLELSHIRNDLHLDYPPVYVSEECRVTMPTDVWVNRYLERIRGDGRHGSCGLGINETVTRYDVTTAPRLKALRDMVPYELADYIKFLREEYTVDRLVQAGITVDDNLLVQMTYETYAVQFINSLMSFMWDDDDIHIVSDADLYATHPHLIFEGAQGLLLDEHKGEFPYVTRSNTGLTNVVDQVAGDAVLNVWYVTRAYLTRHGAGPLVGEDSNIGSRVTDLTNKPNDWQGSLRFAPLDPLVVVDSIRRDLEAYKDRDIRVQLVMTCCDQVDSQVVTQLNAAFRDSNTFSTVWNCSDPAGKTLQIVG